MKLAYESRLNILLSELLNQIGVVSHSEYIGAGRKDIILYHQGLAIVLEGSYDKQDSEKDAKGRIEQLSADVAIAVHYPSSFSQELTENEIKEALKKSSFAVRVVVPEDISDNLFQFLYKKNVIATPVADWFSVDINLLATLIQEITQFIISEEIVKQAEDEVGQLVNDFVGYLTNHKQTEAISENLYTALYRLYGFSIGEPARIKEAVFAQSSLAILLGSVYYESIRYAYKLDSLSTRAGKSDAKNALESASTDILKIDYESIFELVGELMKALPPMPRLLNRLIDLAGRISSKRTLLRRDLAGKIYHKVVGDWALKKGLATYFTQVPAAYLLLYLAKPNLGRLADFACGSGTLLVAAYSAANSQYRMSLWKSGSDKTTNEIEKEFHTDFIDSCYAFDVLGYATQITALNLALHSPETPIIKPSPIYTMPLGYRPEDHFVSLGSLELSRARGNIDQIFKKALRTGIDKKEKTEIHRLKSLAPFDLVAMNPPFSRTTGRGRREGGGLFGFMGDEVTREAVLASYNGLRDIIQERMVGIAFELLRNTKLKNIFSDPDLRQFKSVWQAGEGLVFIHLADEYIRMGGKICFVLPRGLLCGVTWFLARALIAKNYHLEYVIVSYEPGNYNFSESTYISECMFIARRVEEHEPGEETKFVILLKKPKTSMEAIALSKEIEINRSRYIEAGGSKAFCLNVKRKELLDNLDNWGRFVFLPNLSLLSELESILEGKLKVGRKKVALPLIQLNNLIVSIGPDRHRFVDTFRPVEEEVPGSVRMLWGGEEARRIFMDIGPNAYALPIISSGKETFERTGGHLLVPDRIRINTTHVIAMYSAVKMISNIFYSIRLKDETPERLKTLCAWLNTTWGILTILASREETHGGFISMKMSQWRLLPVLDLDQLTPKKIKALAGIFDTYAKAKLPRIPEQYGVRGRVDKCRKELDVAFLKIMGINETDSLSALYQDFAQSLKQWIGYKDVPVGRGKTLFDD